MAQRTSANSSSSLRPARADLRTSSWPASATALARRSAAISSGVLRMRARASAPSIGTVDVIVPEPSGGAHRDQTRAAELLGDAVALELEILASIPPAQRRAARRAKFRTMGAYQE